MGIKVPEKKKGQCNPNNLSKQEVEYLRKCDIHSRVYPQHMKRLCLIIIFVFITLQISVVNYAAQNLPYKLDPDKKFSQYILENYRTDSGLPSNILRNIHHAKNGYIWISSYDGLVRFDGTKFTVFNSQNTEIFKIDGFSVFAEDQNDRLLIGTFGNGVYTYKNGIFEKLGSKEFDEIIESILIDKDENIWIGTRNSGLYIFKDGLYKKMFEDSDKINSSVITMLQKENGEIYFGTSKEGVFSYKNGILNAIPENHKLMEKTIHSIAYNDSGILWIGTIRGLYKFDGKQLIFIEALSNQYITKLYNDASNNLFISSRKGIYRKTTRLEWQNLTIELNISNSNDFVFDHEGNMWITSFREGLFSLKDSKITSYSASDGIKGGINAVIELQDNRFLIGSRSGNLYTADSTGVKPFKIKNSLSDGYLTHIVKDSRDNILISTTEGILKITPDGTEIWLTKKIGLGKIFVRLVFEDSQHNLWIGTNRKGLIKLLTDGSHVIYDKSDGLKGNMILSIAEDKNKSIIIGTAGGGLSFITKENRIKNFTKKSGFPTNTTFYTYIDKTGTKWIASNTGLIRFKDNTFFTFSKKNGFPANTVYKILEDNNEDFWITSNSEIIRVSRRSLDEFATNKITNLEYKTYGKLSGIKQAEFTTVSNILKAKNGSLWFASTTILISIETEKLPFNKIEPPVFIEGMRADNIKVNINRKIMLSPETNRITLDYTALHYFAPSKVHFKYKLEGYENNWIETGNKRSVSYTNLSYGDYTFNVIACNNDGVWNKEGARLSFTVKRFWYETFLFKVLVTLLVLGFIFILYKIRVKQLERSRTKLEQIVKERTADVVKQKEEIQTQAVKLKASVKEINEKNKTLSDYITELKVLRGIVPICSSCKKIRDSDGHWDHIESYIESRSEAQFSHGICKECEVKLYGDQEWYKKRGNK